MFKNTMQSYQEAKYYNQKKCLIIDHIYNKYMIQYLAFFYKLNFKKTLVWLYLNRLFFFAVTTFQHCLSKDS